VGINASKEAIDFIKAGDMLASGDYNGLIEGCLGAEIAIRTLRKQPVPKEVMAKTAVVDKNNYQATKSRPNATLPHLGEHGGAVKLLLPLTASSLVALAGTLSRHFAGRLKDQLIDRNFPAHHLALFFASSWRAGEPAALSGTAVPDLLKNNTHRPFGDCIAQETAA